MSFDEKEIEKAVNMMKQLGLKRFRFVTKQDEFEIELPSPGSHLLNSSSPPPAVSSANQCEVDARMKKNFITSPLVGVFYRRASPESSEYVRVGSRVEEGSVVCIVEAMKVMNEVKAEKSGTITEVLLEDGDLVEFGSQLFCIE